MIYKLFSNLISNLIFFYGKIIEIKCKNMVIYKGVRI
nr:MAG TPA: hypothetical protein [Caudoviricetes sp.]